MTALLEIPVANEKKPAAGRRKRHDYEDRRELFAPIHVFKDVSEWLADISRHETRTRKKSGDLTGGQRASIAKLVDPLLRQWAYERYMRIINAKAGKPDAPIGRAPAAPEPTIELE